MGIDRCRDLTGESYHYDSLVTNHLKVAIDDIAVCLKEREAIGVDTTGDITETANAKIHRK